MIKDQVIALEPVDVWSFRDGKPFDVGEAFEATSLFPPSPWTALGAVRSAVLRALCPQPERYAGRPPGEPCPACGTGPCKAIASVGRAGEPAPFSIGPPLPARRAGTQLHLLFPWPADVVSLDGQVGALSRLAPLELPSGAASRGAGGRPVGRVGSEEPVAMKDCWTTAEGLDRWAQGESPSPLATSDVLARETRIGIGMSHERNTVREGQLYVRDALRLREGVCLAVACSAVPEAIEFEVGRFGGDGRLVRFSVANGVRWPAPPRPAGKRLKLYFASPSWLRDSADPTSWRRHLDGVLGGLARVDVVGTVVSSSPVIGGWDLARQQPRQMRRLVGAGSVVFLEVAAGESAHVARALHGRTLCDDPAMAAAGFGLAFVGGW